MNGTKRLRHEANRDGATAHLLYNIKRRVTSRDSGSSVLYATLRPRIGWGTPNPQSGAARKG